MNNKNLLLTLLFGTLNLWCLAQNPMLKKGEMDFMCLADSPLPTEPFAEFKGYITKEQKDAPLHMSAIEFKGQWYFFYQRGNVNEGTFHRRSACFEEMEFNEDGTNVPIEYTLDE